MGDSESAITTRSAASGNHVWSYDFAMGGTEDGWRSKIMPILNEYGRKCLILEAQRWITAKRTL
jgi:hypothetical protein